MKEIERKYLLNASILKLIDAYGLQGHKIMQYYTTITPNKGVRYRQMDDRYFKTVKRGTGASREEDEVQISEKKFHKHYAKHIKNPIHKTRYMFEYEGKAYSIDVFEEDLKGLFILEIEFDNMQQCKDFVLPQRLQLHVRKEVTYDESYKNKNITLYGKPPEPDDLDAVFSKLAAMDTQTLDSYFIPELSPIDALRVILFKFSLYIRYYKNRVILYDGEEDLHQFRVNIRKSRAFLKEFAFLITQEQYTYIYKNLSAFASFTNQKRDLDVIKERLEPLSEGHAFIQEDIQQQQKDQHLKIVEMLKSDTFEHFFQQYQSMLKDQKLVNAQNSTGSIEEVARKVLQKLHRKLIKKIDALEKNFSIEKLHKIRIGFKKFRYLLEEFQHIFGDEKIAKMIEKGKRLQTLLGDFNDTVNQKTLLHNYFKENKKNISDRKELEKTLLDKTMRSQEMLKHEAMKSLHKFKKKKLSL